MARPGAPFSLAAQAAPFFPGGMRPMEDERSSISSLSVSVADYRTARTSPSPAPIQDMPDPARKSPAYHPVEAGRHHPFVREPSSLSSLESLSEAEFHQGNLRLPNSGTATPNPANNHLPLRNGRDVSPTPPVPIAATASTFSPLAAGAPSGSPVSSLGSSSQMAPSERMLNFEAQLKASPLMHEILERLVKYEYFSREIHRDLGEVRQKVDLLVERSIGPNHSQPEFKDPFAPEPTLRDPFAPNTAPRNFSTPALGGPRPSLGNIAPNQAPPGDDMNSIAQRLNSLTSSVGQLLALQTQGVQAPVPGPGPGPGFPPMMNPGNLEVPPNQIPHPNNHNQAMLGHGLPNRPDLRPSRGPNSPMRTWSAGALELPARPDVGRPSEHLLRDKRRSSTLLRRDSAGILGDPNDNGSGPLITKWDQLSLAPDLLRSLSKFGVGPPNKIQQRALPFLLRGSDIIAQAPPTQERIAAYVIPAIQIAVSNISIRTGPTVLMVSTTVDQATQAQRMIRDLGGPIGIRSALGVGVVSASTDSSQELRLLHQNMPHILCGTPQKLHALFTAQGGLSGSEVRFLVLDEVDQLIARNLHEYVFTIVKSLPSPKTRTAPNLTSPSGVPGTSAPSESNGLSATPSNGRKYSGLPPDSSGTPPINQSVERQTALFSNTVPQDVLNLASAINLREPVRVLVRRDGNVQPSEASQGSRGLKQFYLYLAFTAGGRSEGPTSGGGLGIIGSGRGSISAETAQAREWKLDALADLFDDIDVPQAIIHVGGITALDSVVYKLASRGMEAVPLHSDMNAGTKLAALNKFRNVSSVIMRQSTTKVLVVYDVQVKTPEVNHVPLIINYDLPKAVEEYAQRVSPAIASNYSRAGVVVNFVTATGGDVEMLRSIECFYKIKCPEVPLTLQGLF